MTEQTINDLSLVWNTINSPMKAGNKWCTYSRESINNAIEAMKRIGEATKPEGGHAE